MSSVVVSALITGGLALVGVVLSSIVTVIVSSKTLTSKLEQSQAVTDVKIDELTREVREHNGFAIEIPVMKERIKSLMRRIEELEKLREE